MAETPDASTQPPEDSADDALKKKLLSRIAVAGVLIVALLGGLAVIDAIYVPPPRNLPQKTAALPPEAEKPAEAEKPEEKPVEKAEEKVEEKPAEAVAEKPAEPAPAETPKAEGKIALPTPAPEGTSATGTAPRPPRALTPPATVRPALSRPAEPIATTPRRPDAATEIARTAPPAQPYARHAPPSRPLTQAAERSRQFVVQMGVFNNLANAEELRAKLELAGVPAHIEARVQVGPFASKQEADAAREKIRALGMDDGILMAVRR